MGWGLGGVKCGSALPCSILKSSWYCQGTGMCGDAIAAGDGVDTAARCGSVRDPAFPATSQADETTND